MDDFAEPAHRCGHGTVDNRVRRSISPQHGARRYRPPGPLDVTRARPGRKNARVDSRYGSITDVAGVRVGHAHRRRGGWRTGTTVVVVPGGAVPGVSVRGGGPGTRETDALRPETLVQTIHAVCLSGGSAYGLAAADGVARWLEARGLGVPVSPPGGDADPAWIVPVVPAAVIFDLGRGGDFTRRPTAEFGELAARRAKGGRVDVGSVGAGIGAVAGGLQGGVGTASTSIALDDVTLTIGSLAVVNAAGSVVDLETGLPFEPGSRRGPGRLRAPTAGERRALVAASEALRPPPLNTTIGVIATSAALTKAEACKLADIAHDGIARAVRPSHTQFDGDTVFSLATGQHELTDVVSGFRRSGGREAALHQVLTAAATCFALACTDALLAATLVGGPPAYRDLCPSVLR